VPAQGFHITLVFYLIQKNNNTALVGGMWKRVADKKTLLETAKWIKHDRLLNEILGPDHGFYGLSNKCLT
jgi:hypothetical protein